jgi:hypothetical protein
LASFASSEITKAQFDRERDIGKTLAELPGMVAEMGHWPCSAEENCRREAKLIALWAEARRPASVPEEPILDDVPRRLVGSLGRLS